jgi:hypothetical protein
MTLNSSESTLIDGRGGKLNKDSAREREREIMKIVSSKIFVWLPVFGLVAFSLASTVQAGSFKVEPFLFDPAKSKLVSSEWEKGAGCPTGVIASVFESTPPFNLIPGISITDPACLTGDSKDKMVEGLVLIKTGPTFNNASAGAELKGVKGTTLTELGYDIRKIGPLASDDRGSHCGAGAPRFNVVIAGTEYFIGCNSPPASSADTGTGWVRLRWGGPLLAYQNGVTLMDISGQVVDSISIVFDEGQDASGGPDQFGLAVLDNIDVNGRLVGRGPSDDDKDKDRDKHKDRDRDKDSR